MLPEHADSGPQLGGPHRLSERNVLRQQRKRLPEPNFFL
jgi:hypothetical protein